MRPKKVILLVDDNEKDGSTLKFMLVTNTYRVLAAHSPAEALGVFASNRVDLVLASFHFRGPAGTPNGIELIDKLKALGPHTPMVLLCDPGKVQDQTHRADRLVSKATCSALDLLDIVRVLCARKRGPRKGMTPTPAMLRNQAEATARREPGHAGFSKAEDRLQMTDDRLENPGTVTATCNLPSVTCSKGA
jgi:CheY-like chemotaxis protein